MLQINDKFKYHGSAYSQEVYALDVCSRKQMMKDNDHYTRQNITVL